MENKRIYIDGVDVAGCSYGEIEKDIFKCSCEYNVRSASMFCKDNPNCYYKQLKRKEQECEGLKKDLHQNFREKDKLHLIIDRLLEASGYDTNTASAEEFEDVYKSMCYEKQQLVQLKAQLLDQEAETLRAGGIIYTLEKTLTEIKEIAEGMHDLWINKTPYTDINNLVEHLLECELNRIRYKLDEISEVLEND